jgi:SAM-dependent methyltransferase
MTVTPERATFDAAAFARWCAQELYTPAIRQGTQILELACDIHLAALYRQLGFTRLLATTRTARELSDALGFEASSHIALEAMLCRLAERTGVVSVGPGLPARFQALAEPPEGVVELAALRRAMAALGPGHTAALEFLDFGRENFVTALRDDPGMMDRVLSGADAERYQLWQRATNADPMQDLHGVMGAVAVAELFSGGSVLEIGGGTGNGIRHLLEAFQARGKLACIERFLFTDVSPRFILGTRRAIREAFPSVRCDWKYLDINKAFPDQGVEAESVDLVYGVNAAHVARDIVAMLRQCHAALKPGGRVAFAERVRKRSGEMVPRELTLNLSRYHRTAAQRDPEHRPAHGYLTARCWLVALQRAGFREAAIHPDFAVLDQVFPEHYAAVVTAVRGCGRTE